MSGNFRKLLITLSYYFRNFYRSRSFYLMLVITMLVSGLMIYFTVKYADNLSSLFPNANLSSLGTGEKESVFGFVWSFVLIDLPVFAAVFFGSSAISSEIENRTAYHIFTLPIGRVTLFFGKFLAAFLITTLTVMIYVLAQAVTFLIVFRAPLVAGYYNSIWLLIVFIFAITAFTFMLSSIFNKNTYAYISVFLVYFLVFNAYQIIVEFLYRTTPFYLLNLAAAIIEKVYLNISFSLFLFNFSLSPAPPAEILQSVLIMVAYAIVSLAVALVIFDRKEVK